MHSSRASILALTLFAPPTCPLWPLLPLVEQGAPIRWLVGSPRAPPSGVMGHFFPAAPPMAKVVVNPRRRPLSSARLPSFAPPPLELHPSNPHHLGTDRRSSFTASCMGGCTTDPSSYAATSMASSAPGPRAPPPSLVRP
jgi:hypothetical protein